MIVTRGITFSLILIFLLSACANADPAPLATEAVEPTAIVPMDEPTNEVQAEAEPGAASPTEAPSIADGVLVFQIIEQGTEARFIIDEVLRGEPKTVVGATSKVVGELYVDLADPASSEVGVITIQAETLRTDNNFRNGAIRDFILQTGNYPTITFTPLIVDGLPAQVAVGDTFTFTMTGDLTIRDITSQETFNVTVTAISESEISGSAKTKIQRATYGLNIPSVPQVAGVAIEVFLELDFIAQR